jgi:hypothetical protein
MMAFLGNRALLVILMVAVFSAVGSHVKQLDLNVGYTPTQPINYSHELHAGKLQMDCQYCHVNAERSPHATVPPLSTCMGCHNTVATEHEEVKKMKSYWDKGEPIPWVRIHKVPDHVYFSHQPHMKAGLSCQECHGEIETMAKVGQVRQLEMGDCVSCHRDTDIATKAHEEKRYNLDTKYAYLRYMGKDAREALKKSGKFTSIEGNFHEQTGLSKMQNAPISCDVCHQ